ncbi:MAG: hypothetical protein SPG61_07015, partial [Arcanobacterium sp.]|nr:hypothetical protein [Arcanobacterium sp.]
MSIMKLRKVAIVSLLSVSCLLSSHTLISSAEEKGFSSPEELEVVPTAVMPCNLPDGQWPKPRVTIASKATKAYIKGSARSYGQGPGLLSIEVGRTTTATESISATLSGSASVLFATVSADIGGTISHSTTGQVTSRYEIKVPAGKTMWVEAGMRGVSYSMNVSTFSTSCKWVTK